MIGICSRTAGVLLLPQPGTGEYDVFDVVVREKRDPIEAQYRYAAVQDWEDIEGTDAEALLETSRREYWLTRAVSLLRLALGGLDTDLEKRVLEHVEEILASRASSEQALSRLLVAPLVDPHAPLALGKSALSYGFPAVASVLDEVGELQALLRRLTDLWLSLPETAFSRFREAREMIWLTVVEKHGVKELLTAESRREFAATWNLLAFHFPTPQSKSGVSMLGQELSRRLFPQQREEQTSGGAQPAEVEAGHHREVQPHASSHEEYLTVKREIAAIAQAVSQGRDSKAERFLRQLIERQTSFQGGESFAVKSLCNIAQRCADMFRMDFEALCLKDALRLGPSDAWALIQYGDHCKRLGRYTEAIEAFGEAARYGESMVAASSMADVFSQQGEYERAIATYEGIPDFHDRPDILNAIADNLRKSGRMGEAEGAYAKVIDLAQQGSPEFAANGIRARVGMAEIAKRRGDLEGALRTYRYVVAQDGLDDRELLVYRLSLCNVLKLMGSFSDAYRVVDAVIADYPFSMVARFTRASILGLIGEELKGLEDLPESGGSRSWREWLRRYYRGLLLLKLERYDDAQRDLVEEFSKAIASGEDRAILRMGAAIWFLSRGDSSAADRWLLGIADLYDCHAQYLSLVLRLHSAALRDDLELMDSLREQIAGLSIVDETLGEAVAALGKRDFSLALACETDALLKLAA
jgi:tetratricopeptide (TPR) repeat protein